MDNNSTGHEASDVDDSPVDGDAWEINTTTLEDLWIHAETAKEVSDSWHAYLEMFESEQAAGEAIYSAIFEAAPSLQPLFTGPRGVVAQKFVTGLSKAVSDLSNPASLKTEVETIGFAHLNVDITVPRAALFRDAILDLFEAELADAYTTSVREGWGQLLSYIGGALMYVKANFSTRLRVLQESWKAANSRGNTQPISEAERQRLLKEAKKEQRRKEKEGELEIDPEVASTDSPGSSTHSSSDHSVGGLTTGETRGVWGRLARCCGRAPEERDAHQRKDKEPKKPPPPQTKNQIAEVPKTFEEMFQWNCAVMGLSGRKWMQEILASFAAMVEHIADMKRLQQECNVISIRIAKTSGDHVSLSEFKSCMLAALRSLLPTVWDTNHEVAWNWLWDNIETLLKKTMGKPLMWEQTLSNMLGELSEDQLYTYRSNLYERFFSTIPAGQDFFKQSNTRLHFIAERATQMSLELLGEPWQMVDDISALGLRHVGYGIPTEMFGPFVQAAVDSLRRFVSDELGLEAFSWSLGIIAQMLVHTVTEGSTIVMKAINNNSTLQLASAVNSAPRGKRASWVLIVKVGTQDISPLRWAIESGSLSAAKAIIEDLLTIRADRERYYYGVDDLFARHRDIVQIICSEAPTLLTTFLEGLAWRSRTTDQGMRRVNYYVKNLFVDGNGNFAGALQALVGLGDPQIVSHSVVNVVSNHLWTGLVIQEFIVSKIWFIFSLVVLMVSQTLLPEYRESKEARIGTLFCRAITYMLTLLVLLIQHARDTFKAYYGRDTVRVLRLPVPRYLTQFYHIASLMLMICLVCMWIYEPYIHCVEDPEWPTEYCKGYDESGFIYSVFAMCAVGLHWGLMADLAVFSTGLSAFVLVCVHVGSEIGRFMFALLFLLTTFASAITVLEHGYEDMKQFGESMICLSGITLRLYEDDYRDLQNDPVLLTAVFGFITSSAILLLNLLIAQLNCSYVYVYQNMLGYAKLKRSSVSVQTLRYTKHERWTRFVATLGLDVPLEFNEGDVGMAGGIQVMEPQSLAVVAADRIQRFGGNCSPELEWPADTTIAVDEEEEKLAALEHLLHITLTKLRKGGGSTDKDSKEKHSFLSED
ncbi:unnamed protein product [Effrenium voratum]|nr:unnamed protein product [Effrenium voratum]